MNGSTATGNDNGNNPPNGQADQNALVVADGNANQPNDNAEQNRVEPNDNARRYGPSFKTPLFYHHKRVGFVCTTRKFRNTLCKKEGKALEIAYTSPYCLPFCKYCGRIYRSPAGLQQHFIRTQPGCKVRRNQPNEHSTLVDNPDEPPILEVHVTNNQTKKTIFENYKKSKIGPDQIFRTNRTMLLKYDGKQTGGTLQSARIDQRKFRQKELTNSKAPTAIRDDSAKQRGLGDIAPFILKTSAIIVTEMEAWWGVTSDGESLPTEIFLVACDECTAFGCMGCGSIQVHGGRAQECQYRCFHLPTFDDTNQLEKQLEKFWNLVHYKEKWMVKTQHKMFSCEFVDEASQVENILSNVHETGASRATLKDRITGRPPAEPRTAEDIAARMAPDIVRRSTVDFAN